MSDPIEARRLIELTADIVSAYVGNNTIASSELPKLLGDVHGAVVRGAAGIDQKVEEKPQPMVPVKKSVTPDYIVCLEDGKKFKSLKRHLRTKYDMSPDEYRAKWGLPADYPMVAPSYSAARSQLAQKMGLGRKAAEPAPKARAAAKPAAAKKPKGAVGRPRKAAATA